jgi:CheY-like chemotaxis protein
MILDITAHKEAEEKLLEKQEELIRAKEKAENATKLKDKFLSLVAHDIRSPFSSMLGLLNLLNDNGVGTLNEKQADIVSRCATSGEDLLKMVDDLLNLNRFQTGRITVAPKFWDASGVAGYTVVRLEQLARHKGIKLINGVPHNTRIFADIELFNEVILNFVTNAIKFSPCGGQIEIFIPEGRPTTISVKDTGVGVPPGILPNLFNCEVPTSTRGTAGERGTGLGLPLAHEIMQAHGGSIDVETTVGAGSVFHANLPYVRPVILVVEDDDNERFAYKTILGRMDSQILETKNGEEGLQAALAQNVHLIISDIHMPVMNGCELLANLKKHPKTSQIPVVVLTSSASLESRERVLRLGADDFVIKPVMENELIPRVRRFIC